MEQFSLLFVQFHRNEVIIDENVVNHAISYRTQIERMLCRKVATGERINIGLAFRDLNNITLNYSEKSI